MFLRGGSYHGTFVQLLSGTQAQPITIRPYQTERPIIDGALRINGADTIWQDMEICYTGWTTRISTQNGSAPTDLPINNTLHVFGPRTIMRHCIIHDTAGPGWWESAIDSIFEECISYNNGWDAPDRGHGHGLYAQNETGTKIIRRCVFPRGYSDYTMHIYGQDGPTQGFQIEDCVSINQSGTIFLIGGNLPIDRITVNRAICWGGHFMIGFNGNANNIAATLTDLVLANGCVKHIVGIWPNGQPSETGTDTTTGNRIIVTGNLVIVFNQSQAASVIAPLSGRYRNCQNPIETVVLSAGDPLPMTTWTVAAPIAGVGPLATWDSRFGCFLVEA